MRCIVHCAKDGERLGCVLSSLVPGRRDALHEHAGTPCMNMLCLKSCTAHTGFPCKDHSATLYMVHLSSSLQTVECKIQSVTVLQNQQKSACSCLAPESNRKRNT